MTKSVLNMRQRFARASFAFIAYFSLLFSAPASAAPDCRGDLALPLMSPAEFWKLETPVIVETPGGQLPITLSFDSEVEDDSFLTWEEKVPGMRAIFETMYRGQQFTLAQIASRLQMSEAQVRSFVLAAPYRRAVIGPEQTFTYADILPGYVSRLFELPTNLDYIGSLSAIAKLWNPYLNAQKLPYAAHVDGLMLEFTHKSYEVHPAQFKRTVSNFRSMFRKSHTHFHIGIPNYIGWQETHAIARAVEARLIVALALRWHVTRHELTFNNGTMLVSDQRDDRGVILFDHSEWREPHPTANLELRQWTSLTDAYDTLAMAAVLAQNYRRLHLSPLLPAFHLDHQDPSVGNISGALFLVYEMLKRSGDPADKNLAANLRRLALRIRMMKDLDAREQQALKKETADFLARHKIHRRMTADFFLKPN